MKRLFFVAVFILSISLLLMSAAMSADIPGVTEDTIWIGLPGWYTGPGAAYTVPIRQGVLLAVKEVNDSGGINGRKIKLRIEETSFSPKQAIAVVNRFIKKDKVFCILGANITGNIRAMMPYITRAKIPHMELMASTTVVTAPFNKYLFRSQLNHWYQAWLAADLAASHFGYKKIALFNVSDHWGIETNKATAMRLKEKWGIDPVVYAEADKKQTDVSAAILKMKKANPDCMIAVGWPTTIIPLMRQSRELGLTCPHIGTAAFGYTEVVAAGKYANGYITHLLPNGLIEGNAPEMKLFREKFFKAYPEIPKGIGRPGMWDAVGYASTKLVAETLKKISPNLTRERYIRELENIRDYHSIWQPISFDSKNHDGVRKMRFFKVVNEAGKREILTSWMGNDEILEECQRRSLEEYSSNLGKDYLDMIKDMK